MRNTFSKSQKVKIFFFLFYVIDSIQCLVCNGMEGLCSLNLQHVTLAGTHNSGAGFDGLLKYHTAIGPVLAGSCWYRSQQKSITAQLEFGIRYFDIDTCWENGGSRYVKGAWTCHADAYGGSMKTFLQQVDHWMKKAKNRNEIIVLHFNRDYEKGNEKQIGKDLVRLLDEFWSPTKERVQHNKLSMAVNFHATLGESVRRNQRIFVIFHNNLLSGRRPRHLHAQWKVGYTWTPQGFVGSNYCKGMANILADKCKKVAHSHASFVRLDLYLSWGLCTHHLATYCNSHATLAVNECLRHTLPIGKPVNAIVVDYPSLGASPNVVEVARRQNLLNIQRFGKH